MALSALQRAICRLLADQRIASGESYVAGGSALNELMRAPRRSNDIDLFHDADEALATSWANDRASLEEAGFDVEPIRQRPFFVEASVQRDGEATLVEWARDSAYRFFPLIKHPDLGLVLHPIDLATNKVLALIGRVEARDWVDVIEADRRIQGLGYLAWAACGKDPAFGPAAIIEHAARSARYSAEEVSELDFEGEKPTASELAIAWHDAIERAREVVSVLPADQVGTCVLDADGQPCRAHPKDLPALLADGALMFHQGTLRGVMPTLPNSGA